MGLRDLLDRGMSDEDIAQKLELKNPGLVAYFRARAGEVSSL
jgi:hypothetical protein